MTARSVHASRAAPARSRTATATSAGSPGRRNRRRRRVAGASSGDRRAARASRPSCRARPSVRRGAGLSRPTRRLVSATAAIQHLGAGITTVPSAPVPDPQSVVHRRTPRSPRTSGSARRAARRVGRSRGGQAGPHRGVLPEVPARRSRSRPKLQPGDLVGGQYEVVGCIAHGGLGLDLPRARPQRVRPLRRAEGAAQHRRRRRVRGRDHRAAVPRRGPAPADRRDLQLRRATRAPATSSWSTSAGRRSSRS